MSIEEAIDFVASLCVLLERHHFDRAKHLIDRERDATKIGSLSHWHSLLSTCQLLVTAEKQYVALAYISVRSFLRRDNSASAGYDALIAECTRLSSSAVCSRCSATAALTPVYSELSRVARQRLWMISWYKQLRDCQALTTAAGGYEKLLQELLVQNRHQLHARNCLPEAVCVDGDTCWFGDDDGDDVMLSSKAESGSELVEASCGNSGRSSKEPCVSVLRRCMLRESECIAALLLAHRYMWRWRYTDSLIHLDRADSLLQRMIRISCDLSQQQQPLPCSVSGGDTVQVTSLSSSSSSAIMSGNEHHRLPSFLRTKQQQQQQQQAWGAVALHGAPLFQWLRRLHAHTLASFTLVFRTALCGQSLLLSGDHGADSGQTDAPTTNPTLGDDLYARLVAFQRRYDVALVAIVFGSACLPLISPPHHHIADTVCLGEAYVHPRACVSSAAAALSSALPQPFGATGSTAELFRPVVLCVGGDDDGITAGGGGGDFDARVASRLPQKMRGVWQQLVSVLEEGCTARGTGPRGSEDTELLCRLRETTAGGWATHYVLELSQLLALVVVARGKRAENDTAVTVFMREFRATLFCTKIFLQLPAPK